MGRHKSCQKKNLKSIDYMRQKVKKKNLNYNFLRIDKEKDIEIFDNAGWHFNNIMEAEKISMKLKSFAHEEYAKDEYSSIKNIENKIEKGIDLFGRGHVYKKVILDESYPNTYIFGDVENIDGMLSTEQELNLFRIIQECLSNVVKHAKAELAKLELLRDKNTIIMTLQDNGIGFDFLTKFKNLKSLGLKTIKERVNYINGILRVESSPGNGSKFKVEIHTV